MEVIRLNLSNYLEKIDQGLVVALGYFDGIHRAHMDLIDEVIDIGKKKNLKTGIVTFHPHPAFVLNKKSITSFLTPLEVKLELLEKIDLDYVFIVDFDIEVAKIDHKDFVEKFFLPLNIKYVVAGFDNRYGYMGKGSVKTLKEDSDNSIEVVVIEELKVNKRKIGSTYIRDLLNEGDVKTVSNMLGRYYSIDGFVTHGRGRGKSIGIPTANLAPKYPYEIPAKGVYVVKVYHDNDEYYGVCNIGNNPTFNYNENKTIEINILDFNKDIYGDYIRAEFVDRIREEVKFDSIEKLVIQINKDKNGALNIIKNL
ncbi:bifunctional riboflavin kinase/FAD synthetase [Mycoplasmatota bacterium WC44]